MTPPPSTPSSSIPNPGTGEWARTCLKCAYVLRGDGSRLECRRWPPVWPQDGVSGVWPAVPPTGWCGEWRSRAEGPEWVSKVKQVERYTPESGGTRDSNPLGRRWVEMTEGERMDLTNSDPEMALKMQRAMQVEGAKAWDRMDEEARTRMRRLMKNRASWMERWWKDGLHL